MKEGIKNYVMKYVLNNFSKCTLLHDKDTWWVVPLSEGYNLHFSALLLNCPAGPVSRGHRLCKSPSKANHLTVTFLCLCRAK